MQASSKGQFFNANSVKLAYAIKKQLQQYAHSVKLAYAVKTLKKVEGHNSTNNAEYGQ